MARTKVVVSLACLLQFGSNEGDDLVRRALNHHAFAAYSKGEVDRDYAIQAIAARYKVDPALLRRLLSEVPSHCKLDKRLLSTIQSLDVQVFGWLDIPTQEWQEIQLSFPDTIWKLFIEINRDFEYLTIGNGNDCKIVVIDRNVEVASIHNSSNIVALPYAGNLHHKESCLRRLGKLTISSCIKKIEQALENTLASYSTWCTRNGTEKKVYDFFAVCLAAMCEPKVVHDEDISYMFGLVKDGEPFGFFGKDSSIVGPDIDSMSISTSTLFDLGYITQEEGEHILDICLANVNSEGNLLVYLDPQRPRQDPVVVCNLLYLAYTLGKENHPVVRHNEVLVQNYLFTKGYLYGTSYYPQQETFLFHYGRIVTTFGERNSNYHKARNHIRNALVNCIGDKESRPLDLAKRVLLSLQFDVNNMSDLELLLEIVNVEGVLPAGVIYSAYTTDGTFFNRGVDLSYVLKALKEVCSLQYGRAFQVL